MRIIRRTFANLNKSTLFLGKAGENLVTRLEIDVSKELSEYTNPSFDLILNMPSENEPYPVFATLSGSKLIYNFTENDLSKAGNGQIEALVAGSNGEVLKSTTAKTVIEPSINPNTYPGPIQRFIEQLENNVRDIVMQYNIEVVDALPSTARAGKIVYLIGSGFYYYSDGQWDSIASGGSSESDIIVAQSLSDLENVENGKVVFVPQTIIEDGTTINAGIYLYDENNVVPITDFLTSEEKTHFNAAYQKALELFDYGTIEHEDESFSPAFGNNELALKSSVDSLSGSVSEIEQRIDNLVPPDTLETLELNTAYDTLIVRPDWADVPVYNITSNETVAELCDSGDHIMRLIYLIDEVTGMPCPELFIKTGGVSYVCLSATYHDIGSVTRQAGWYTVDDMEYLGTTPPTITNMTFTTLEVAKDGGMPDAYTSLSSLPAKAQCALETLCRMVNVSVDAMGGLGVVENSVQRLTNAPQFGGQYAFTAAQDITLPLPSTTFVTGEASFTIDLHCTQNIMLNIPRDLLRSGGRNPDTRQGYHRLTFRYEHNAGKFSVEETAQVVPQYWDDIPDTVIPLEQCTWAQIKSIGQHGYLNSVSQWCILRNGTEEVWFEIGDTKTLTLTNGTVLPLVILGFRHDDVWDGSGKAPFTFGMANDGTTATYVMNQTATNSGGWEDSYMRRVTMQSFLNVFPSDLRNVVVAVNKKTALSSDVTSITQDEVWIQSKEELSGQSDVRYAYYLSHSYQTGGQYWSWMRDPVLTNDAQFYFVSSSGFWPENANYNFGHSVMICFCV